MPERIHLYAKIHKAQRAWLMRCLVAAGRADAADSPAATVLAADVRRLANHIHEHGQHEEQFIHPLLSAADPQLALRLDAEHAALDGALAEFARAADANDIAGLYPALTGFVVRYFPHLDIEEHQAMPAIWRAFDDGALLDRVMRPFISSRSSAEIIEDLDLQLGALNPHEERQLLGAFTQSRL